MTEIPLQALSQDLMGLSALLVLWHGELFGMFYP